MESERVEPLMIMPSLSLITANFMVFAISALITLTLLYLKFLKINAPATGAWAIAFACICARNFCLLLIPIGYPLLSAGVDLFAIGFASSLWLGSYRYKGERVSSRKILLLLAGAFMLVLVVHLTKTDFFWRVLPAQMLAGAITLVVASNFWQTYRAKKVLPMHCSLESSRLKPCI